MTTVVRPLVVPRRRNRLRMRENIAGYVFLAPWLLGLVTLVGGPMLVTLYFSLTNYSLLGSPKFIGFQNYQRIFTQDPNFWKSLQVTFTYLGISVPGVIIVALSLAVALNRGIRGLGAYRAIFYVPSLIGGSVAVALLWRTVFDGNGLFNGGLSLFGLHVTTSWIDMPDNALGTLVVLSIWQFGAPMVIFLAGLKQVPEELYEAAKMDGAGPTRCFWSVTLPMMSPIIFFNILMTTIAGFQAFNSAYVVSNGTGGPASSTLFYTLYIYQRAFVDFQMGYASALAWVLLVLVAIVVAVLFRLSRRVVFYGDR